MGYVEKLFLQFPSHWSDDDSQDVTHTHLSPHQLCVTYYFNCLIISVCANSTQHIHKLVYGIGVQTLQEVSGFIDADRVHKDARPALMADLVSEEHSIIASAFGMISLNAITFHRNCVCRRFLQFGG